VLGACDQVLEAELRGVLLRDDDYASAGKPVCDYEDPQARKALIDALGYELITATTVTAGNAGEGQRSRPCPPRSSPAPTIRPARTTGDREHGQ
jgi:hypothetical protein